MVPLLKIDSLSKTFALEEGLLRRPTATLHALENVSFEIGSGETLAVVGGSGSGKSTLAKILVGLLEADAGSNVSFDGNDLLKMSHLERSRNVQMIFQDPFSSLNQKLTIETQLMEMVSQGDSPSSTPLDRQNRCAQLLEMVGMPVETLRHYPFQFSGGQRQRIAIARALALRPKLLIADEPLSALDVTIQSQILKLFTHLKKDIGLTMLFITHDLAILDGFADRIVVLEKGKIAEEGIAADLLSAPHHPYTQRLLAAVPRIHY